MAAHPDTHCPLVSCPKRGEHEHVACEDCGAVNHGNTSCLRCMRWQCRRWGNRAADGSTSLFRVRVKALERGLHR